VSGGRLRPRARGVIHRDRIALCALLSWRLIRNPPADAGTPLSHLFATTVTVMVSTTMLGPFMLLPMLAFANTTAYLASTGRKRRAAVVAAGCAAVLVPPLLQWLSMLPRSYEIRDGVIAILPVMFDLPTAATTVFLLVSNVCIILTGAYYIS
jgi:hypothetical protein